MLHVVVYLHQVFLPQWFDAVLDVFALFEDFVGRRQAVAHTSPASSVHSEHTRALLVTTETGPTRTGNGMFRSLFLIKPATHQSKAGDMIVYKHSVTNPNTNWQSINYKKVADNSKIIIPLVTNWLLVIDKTVILQ